MTVILSNGHAQPNHRQLNDLAQALIIVLAAFYKLFDSIVVVGVAQVFLKSIAAMIAGFETGFDLQRCFLGNDLTIHCFLLGLLYKIK